MNCFNFFLFSRKLGLLVSNFFVLFCLIYFTFLEGIIAQSLPTGYPLVEEVVRREQMMGNERSLSLMQRPIKLEAIEVKKFFDDEPGIFFPLDKENQIGLFPIRSTSLFNTKRPYGEPSGIMIPSVGFQQFLTGGIYGKFSIFNFQFHPEFVYAQNLSYQGYSSDFSARVNRDRFLYWNVGDFPERFGEASFSRFWWGQSKISLTYGSFELGASTENIWWGPGQFNALTFGNQAQGFPHLTFNTVKPARTFLGSFEGQLIMGRLEDSQLAPTQNPRLNGIYFRQFSGDWKYLNALNLIYQPKWVEQLFIGFTRTFQQYENVRGNRMRDWMPVLDPFQKTSVGFDRDAEGKDQQVSVSMKYLIPSASAEIYGEYGRRDHAYNWREFILNPDHARAYLVGFGKIFNIRNSNKKLQLRGEMTQQQESVNRYIRYYGLKGGITWHTHSRARGFTNQGQALGVGAGVGSNVQTLEISIVEKFNKLGFLLERVANHQDFYYRAFGQQDEVQPWVDLSVGVIFNRKWNNVLLGSKFQLVNGKNYQWQTASDSSPDFPDGKHLLSFNGNLHLVYLWDFKNN